MFEHKTLYNLEDYFLNLSQRTGNTVYVYRINGYNEEIVSFIHKYYEAARLYGMVIEGKLPNPDERNLEYYEEMMGMDFQLSMGFLTNSLKKWLPRMTINQIEHVSASLYDTLEEMRKDGKTENILKNTYIKFMCWLYYKFERIVNQLGQDRIPKILYQGAVSNYELKLITVLAHAGCDVVFLQYDGDEAYLSLDKSSAYSIAYPMTGLAAFPQDFSIQQVQEDIEECSKIQRIYGPPPQWLNCTNAWIEGKGLPDIMKYPQNRGTDPKLFYNCFYRMNGVEDKLTYLNDLYLFYLQIKGDKRRIVIENQQIEKPSMEEIGQIQRGTYQSVEQMATGLSENIQYSANLELQKLMRKAFLDVVFSEWDKSDKNLNKLMNKAVYLLCWLKRYQSPLFSGWKLPEISCFIYLGGCSNNNESLLFQMLAKLPVDVLILVPDKEKTCVLQDDFLYDLTFQDSLTVDKFPSENGGEMIGTVAYHAERDLDTLLYQDSGIYRNQQCKKAETIVLKTMYEEIALLWNQELKYRPNFNVVDDIVTIPTIFAKVSGVKDGLVTKYWENIKKLESEDTYFIHKAPFFQSIDQNLIRPFVTGFFKNGKLLMDKIKSHKNYKYAMLREEMQDHLLNKIQQLIEKRSIKGIFENGTEYTVIAVALNLNKELVRMIQKFDFTKRNPKIIYINTKDTICSLEDSILVAYLNLVGFDVVFYVPTGYQTVEGYFTKKIMEEHQIGTYVYDLNPPTFSSTPLKDRNSWKDWIFKRD